MNTVYVPACNFSNINVFVVSKFIHILRRCVDIRAKLSIRILCSSSTKEIAITANVSTEKKRIISLISRLKLDEFSQPMQYFTREAKISEICNTDGTNIVCFPRLFLSILLMESSFR